MILKPRTLRREGMLNKPNQILKYVDPNYGKIIWDFLSYGDHALVVATIGLSIATIYAGVTSARAIRSATKNSDKALNQQLEFNQKQHKVQGLLEAFRLLNSPEDRKSRKKVIYLYFEFLKRENVDVFGDPQAGDIMADFDVIGKLVENDNISINEFYNVYGSMAYRYWKLLEIYITNERKTRGLPKFMTNFEALATDGYIYWDQVENYDLNDTILHYQSDDPNEPKQVRTFKQIVEINEGFLAKLK